MKIKYSFFLLFILILFTNCIHQKEYIFHDTSPEQTTETSPEETTASKAAEPEPEKPKPEPLFITVKNGERMSDFISRMENRNILTREAAVTLASLEKFNDFPWVPQPLPRISRFEGVFLPGTYRFSRYEIETAGQAGNEKEEWALSNGKVILHSLLAAAAGRYAGAGTVKNLSPFQQIILASIVEKEAASNRYYREIAGVFYNRLERKVKLGSCPTVQYGLGYHRPFLLLADLDVDSPYNVYRYIGLPPTPICFFSDQAWSAVHTPEKTDYFFFVFDWTDGEMYFSVWFEDHQKYVDRIYTNYINRFGYESVHRLYPDSFYEDINGAF